MSIAATTEAIKQAELFFEKDEPQYPIKVPGLPKGYVPDSYRVPMNGVDLIYSNGKVELCNFNGVAPWLIVKKEKPLELRLRLSDQVREVQYREFYEGIDGFIHQWTDPNYPTDVKYRIWEVVNE